MSIDFDASAINEKYQKALLKYNGSLMRKVRDVKEGPYFSKKAGEAYTKNLVLPDVSPEIFSKIFISLIDGTYKTDENLNLIEKSQCINLPNVYLDDYEKMFHKVSVTTPAPNTSKTKLSRNIYVTSVFRSYRDFIDKGIEDIEAYENLLKLYGNQMAKYEKDPKVIDAYGTKDADPAQSLFMTIYVNLYGFLSFMKSKVNNAITALGKLYGIIEELGESNKNFTNRLYNNEDYDKYASAKPDEDNNDE